MADVGMVDKLVRRAGLAGKPGLWLIGIIIFGLLETVVLSLGLSTEATAALAVVVAPLSVLLAYIAVQNGRFWDRVVREPAIAAKVRELFADRRQAPDEPDGIQERATRLVQQAGKWPEVTSRLDTAIALRALIWPDVLAAVTVTALLILSPSTGLVVVLAVLVVLFPVLITSFRAAKLEHLDALYRSTVDLLSTPNYYYCYISSRKLDQLVGTAEVEPAAPADGEEGTQYGPPGLLLRADAGRQLAARLQFAIRKLEGQRGGLPDLGEAIASGEDLRPGAYRHSGRYKVLRYDSRFVYLQSKLPKGVLKLTCSVSHFSRTATEDGELDLHSGNVDFLTGEAQADFRAIVFLTDVRKLVGTPLYLALPLESRLSL